MCKTYSIIQFIRLFYKFLGVENKNFNVENEKVINKANLRKKGWKNIIHPKSHFIPIIITTISEELSTGSGYFLRRRIEFFDYYVQILLKLFVGGELTLYFFDSAHYGCMIFFPEDLSDFLKRCIGVLPAKIHDNLSGKNDLRIPLF